MRIRQHVALATVTALGAAMFVVGGSHFASVVVGDKLADHTATLLNEAGCEEGAVSATVPTSSILAQIPRRHLDTARVSVADLAIAGYRVDVIARLSGIDLTDVTVDHLSVSGTIDWDQAVAQAVADGGAKGDLVSGMEPRFAGVSGGRALFDVTLPTEFAAVPAEIAVSLDLDGNTVVATPRSIRVGGIALDVNSAAKRFPILMGVDAQFPILTGVDHRGDLRLPTWLTPTSVRATAAGVVVEAEGASLDTTQLASNDGGCHASA